MTNYPLVIGFCGSTSNGRKEALKAVAALHPQAVNVTVPPSVRATWRRGDHLELALTAEELLQVPVVMADISCLEEAEVIESFGGHVVHVEGLPSDDIPIQRDTLLITVTGENRGRYTDPQTTMEKLMELAA